MSSEIKADKWSPASGTSGTIGDSGDTFTVPSGVTLDTSSSTLTLPSSVITGQTEKTSLVDADKFLISDSAASGALKYVQKSNLPSGALTKVGSATTLRNSHGDADISNCFTTDYDAYLVTFAITTDRDGNSVTFKFGTGTNNSSFITSGYNYHQFGYPSNGTGITQRYSDPTSQVQLSEGTMGSTSSIMWSVWGNIMIYRPNNTTEFKPFDFRGAWYDTSGHVRTINGAGRSDSTTAVTGMRFNPSANYFFSSDIHVYGLES